MDVYLHERQADDELEAGYTVTKNENLPTGDFKITEYVWPGLSLWFLDSDNFTVQERERVYQSLVFGFAKVKEL